MKSLADQLRENGLKVTPQRMAIYSMLSATTTHPTAEEVWEEIKKDFPAVSFNTVYTTLGTLEQAGLIQRLHIGENIAHYDANIAPHVHLHCVKCGKVEDYHQPLGIDLETVGREVSEQTKYNISKVEMNLYGTCAQCKAH